MSIDIEARVAHLQAEYAARLAAVRAAKIEAHRQGHVAPSPERLTELLGDECGATASTRKRPCRSAYRRKGGEA